MKIDFILVPELISFAENDVMIKLRGEGKYLSGGLSSIHPPRIFNNTKVLHLTFDSNNHISKVEVIANVLLTKNQVKLIIKCCY